VGNQPNTATTIEIVGMVKDFSFRVVRADDEPDHVFFPFADSGPLAGNGVFFVKTRGDQTSAMAAVRAAIEQVDPRLPILFRTLDGQVDRALRSERMLAVLSSAFGAVALLLSAVGLFGVMSFLVTRRTQEIGVRLALGATRRAAIWLVVRDALTMIAIGTAIAIPAAWTLRRLVETQLFGVSAFDGPTIAAAIAVLGIAALGATLLPAWRAASVNPTRALRLD
jgi:ABC-type antimicrobial peptide transport system permease subunit